MKNPKTTLPALILSVALILAALGCTFTAGQPRTAPDIGTDDGLEQISGVVHENISLSSEGDEKLVAFPNAVLEAIDKEVLDFTKNDVYPPEYFTDWSIDSIKYYGTKTIAHGIDKLDSPTSEVLIYTIDFSAEPVSLEDTLLAGAAFIDDRGRYHPEAIGAYNLAFIENGEDPIFLTKLVIRDMGLESEEIYQRLKWAIQVRHGHVDEVLEKYNALFQEDVYFWYQPIGGGVSSIPQEHSFILPPEGYDREGVYYAFADCVWEQTSSGAGSSGPAIYVGNASSYFEIFLHTPYVSYCSNGTTTTWEVTNSTLSPISDKLLFQLSGIDSSIYNIEVPVISGEGEWESLVRFMEAYKTALMNQFPESYYAIEDFNLYKTEIMPSEEDNISAQIEFRLKPSLDPIISSPWIAGNGIESQGEFEGYLEMMRIITLTKSQDRWVCYEFGTG